MKRLALCFLAIFAFPPALAQPTVDGAIAEGEYANSVTHEDSGITLSWTVAGDGITIALSGAAEGWMGIGFLQEQADAKLGNDSYMFTIVGGVPVAFDMIQKDKKGEPDLDTDKDGAYSLQAFAATREGEQWTIEFSRLLDTGEATDVAIVPGQPMFVLLAIGDEYDLDERHSKRDRWYLEGFTF